MIITCIVIWLLCLTLVLGRLDLSRLPNNSDSDDAMDWFEEMRELRRIGLPPSCQNENDYNANYITPYIPGNDDD